MTTYAVHVPDGGTSEYTGYEFTSVVELLGVLYGVNSTGLYSLTGNTDNTTEIATKLGIGYDDSSELSALPYVYLEAETAEPFTVGIAVGTDLYEYETSSYNTTLRYQRAEVGKGLNENAYYVFVSNTSGGDFTLFEVSLSKVPGTRRIYG